MAEQETDAVVDEQPGATTGESAAPDTTASDTTVSQEVEAVAETVETATEQDAASWPDDWRDRLAKGDDKALNRLKRFASPENLVRSLMEAETKIRSGEYRKALPEDATDDDVAAWRKANGYPEEASADAYGVTFPDGLEVTETDKGDLDGFVKAMHDAKASPDVVKGAWDYYLQMRQQAEQQAYDAALERTEEYRQALRDEWGRDYKRNVRVGDNFLSQHLGDGAKELTATTLADGTKLGDHPEFVKFIVQAGLASSDDTSLAVAEMSPGADLEAEYRKALDLQFSDPKAYHSEAHQQKLLKLATARSKRAA